MTHPETLTSDYLDEHLATLDGWQSVAQEVIEEMPQQTQEAAERLVGTMTDKELEAARSLFWPVRDLLHAEARKVYDRMGPASHELTEEDVTGLSWAVFIRCLATYDRSAHLTTWVQINAKAIFRTYILRVRDRDDTERRRRARRKIYQLERRTLTEKGRQPSRQEYAEAVREVRRYGDWDRQRISRLVDYLTSDDLPRRLDRPFTMDGESTLHDTTPDDTSERLNTELLGRKVAERLGKEDLWTTLTTT